MREFVMLCVMFIAPVVLGNAVIGVRLVRSRYERRR